MKGVIKIRTRDLFIMMILFTLIFTVSAVSASQDNEGNCLKTNIDNEISLEITNEYVLQDTSSDLENKIINAENGEEILINPGTYYLHDINIAKNITLQGNGNPSEIIFDGENKSSILLVRSDAVHLTLKNITFINAYTDGFGGAVSMETGHVYVDNCNFINNTAGVNAGGISNYGTDEERGYLLVNNSLFVNNYAGHDGGAVTTCYASSDIYNSVFIANSAHRDGGAIRVSVFGYGNVENCTFMYNHADEWGGAYYSWASNSNINRCIFMNNTAGTNGGAVMISGNMTLTNSIIVNNTSNETGGSFYIQQPMFNATTVMNIHDNLITNNTSPLGKEIYISWKTVKLLFTKFNNNDWGDEDPTDSSIIDPDHVTTRSKVTSTKKSNLLDILSLDILNRYSDVLKDYFPEGYFDGDDDDANQESYDSGETSEANVISNENYIAIQNQTAVAIQSKSTAANNITNQANQTDSNVINVNGTSDVGSDLKDMSKASELIKHSPSKTIKSFSIGAIIFAIIAIIALIYGYKRNKNEN